MDYTWHYVLVNKYVYFATMYIVLFGECYQFIINTYGNGESRATLLEGLRAQCLLPACLPSPQGGEEGCSLVD